jgi:hypothetical protein
MEVLTFVSICLVVMPLYVAMFMVMRFGASKFDKYEAVALRIIDKCLAEDIGAVRAQPRGVVDRLFDRLDELAKKYI